jgi:hypothetical protein
MSARFCNFGNSPRHLLGAKRSLELFHRILKE